jgi:hypothetical protein
MLGTLLPLDEWRRIIGYNPFHFWQLANAKVPLTSSCNTIVRQYAWQDADAAGRSEIREMIGQAEGNLAAYLKYSPAPHWRTETLDLLSAATRCSNGAYYARLSEGRISQVATQTWTLINTSSSLNYSDADLDGLDETFTAEVADATTDPADVSLFFALADRLPGTETDLEYYKIAPATITRKDAATLKAVGKKWLLVKPLKYEGVGNVPGYDASMTGGDSSGSFDPDNAANFVSSVAFYKSVVSNPGKATLTVQSGVTSNTYNLDVTVTNRQTGEAKVWLSAGQVSGPACWCGCGNPCWWNWGCSGCYSSCCSACPVEAWRVTITYQAGEALSDWQTIIARLAAAELDRKVSACDTANKSLTRWQRDLSQTQAGANAGATFEGYRIDDKLLGNFFGTRAGQVFAYLKVRDFQLVRGLAF